MTDRKYHLNRAYRIAVNRIAVTDPDTAADIDEWVEYLKSETIRERRKRTGKGTS